MPADLLHASSERGNIFVKLAPALSKTHAVYTPDSLCHGQSEITRRSEKPFPAARAVTLKAMIKTHKKAV